MKIGFIGMLTILFITLKLTKVIDWSWWYVTMPMYGLFFLFCTFYVLSAILEELRRH